MLTDKVRSLIEDQLAAVGFTAVEDYGECKGKNERLGMKYLAYWRVKEISLSDMKQASVSECSADFTVEVRMFGAKRGFYDRARLAQMAEGFNTRLIFTSSMIVKKLSCGDICRNMQLGRLEYPITVKLCTSIKQG